MDGGVRSWEAWTLAVASLALAGLVVVAQSALTSTAETLPRCSEGSYLQGTCEPDESGMK